MLNHSRYKALLVWPQLYTQIREEQKSRFMLIRQKPSNTNPKTSPVALQLRLPPKQAQEPLRTGHITLEV